TPRSGARGGPRRRGRPPLPFAGTRRRGAQPTTDAFLGAGEEQVHRPQALLNPLPDGIDRDARLLGGFLQAPLLDAVAAHEPLALRVDSLERAPRGAPVLDALRRSRVDRHPLVELHRAAAAAAAQALEADVVD